MRDHNLSKGSRPEHPTNHGTTGTISQHKQMAMGKKLTGETDPYKPTSTENKVGNCKVTY